MEHMGESYISVHYKKQDFIKLNLSPFSDDEEKWDLAISIFEDRIKGRYLDMLHEIMDNKSLMRDGFLVMAINCLLIETLMQFKNGWNVTQNGNKNSYTAFLMKEFPHIFFNKKLADKFYSDIRCGILHSAQTKSKSKLTFNKEVVVGLFELNNHEYIEVDVLGITEAIQRYFTVYVSRLRNNEEDERFNFLQKMNFICKK